MAYEHLFFDWDHTLWDFETNSKKVLEQIYYEYNLRRFGILSPNHFIEVYMPINYRMWREFREGKIDTETVKYKRFEETFKEFGVINIDLAMEVKAFYLSRLPLGGVLMPNVIQTLSELEGKYQLHVVTNGFLEVTEYKIKHSNIASFFKVILSAEEVGVLKPNPQVFEEAFKRSGATADNSLFIGDNLIADVQGARNVGMHQVYYNPEKEVHEDNPTYEIADMHELVSILQQ